MMSPNSPHDKRLPFFSNLERDRPEEVASSWSYMPQGPNAGMPRVRPQQPELQEPSGPSSRIAPLSFGTSTTTTSSTGSSGSSVSGSYGEPSTPRHRRHKHRTKEDSSNTEAVQKSPLSALTFGSPKNPSLSPLSDSLDGMTLNDPGTPTSKGTTIEVRVRTAPKKESSEHSSQEKTDSKTDEK